MKELTVRYWPSCLTSLNRECDCVLALRLGYWMMSEDMIQPHRLKPLDIHGVWSLLCRGQYALASLLPSSSNLNCCPRPVPSAFLRWHTLSPFFICIWWETSLISQGRATFLLCALAHTSPFHCLECTPWSPPLLEAGSFQQHLNNLKSTSFVKQMKERVGGSGSTPPETSHSPSANYFSSFLYEHIWTQREKLS